MQSSSANGSKFSGRCDGFSSKYLHHTHFHLSETPTAYMKLQEDAQNIYPYLDQSTGRAGLSSLVLSRQSRHREPYTDSGNAILTQESAFFCKRIINEAKLSSCCRPLGAAYVAPCLVVALGSAEDP
ncbi:uncharacterized protein N7479_001076 [Penicillium vulpinum]|uniref:uncharacterized protein n=1 Tax=Penicillium vulpinum TaxID=29845 RepID=UPI0025491886|nr:uncharacterized protein N7479_001076 [Penicillium vulpinum]KAJ5971158.1 hypothetical protein N7479_001076 [Penicillium vulpinum]